MPDVFLHVRLSFFITSIIYELFTNYDYQSGLDYGSAAADPGE